MSSAARQFICEAPDPQSNEGPRRYSLSAELLEFLRAFDGERSIAEATRVHRTRYPETDYSEQRVAALIENFCLPRGLLIDLDHPNEIAAPKRTGPSYVRARLPLMSHRFVYPVARTLGHLFAPPVFIALIVLAVAAHVWVYLYAIPHSHISLDKLTGGQFLIVTLLTIGAAFFHEFGHAAALARHQEPSTPLEIGFGIYLYIPVLYTNVSGAWRLTQAQRAVVDIGGVYFQSICELALLGMFVATGDIQYVCAILLVDISIASSLNPLLRMDGYWLLADLCALTNPRKQSLAVVQHALRSAVRLPVPAKSPLHALSPVTAAIVCVYSVASTIFFAYLAVLISYQVCFQILPSYPGVVQAAIHTIAMQHALNGAAGAALLLVWSKSLMLFGTAVGLRQLVQFCGKQISSRIARRQRMAGQPEPAN